MFLLMELPTSSAINAHESLTKVNEFCKDRVDTQLFFFKNSSMLERKFAADGKEGPSMNTIVLLHIHACYGLHRIFDLSFLT